MMREREDGALNKSMEQESSHTQHPGKILSERYLKPNHITPYQLAKAMGVSQTQISEIIRGKRSITPATAIRLGQCLGTTAEFWMNLQGEFDVKEERSKNSEVLKLTPLLTSV